jgi:peptidoglycan hydrolase CwlO-like protein
MSLSGTTVALTHPLTCVTPCHTTHAQVIELSQQNTQLEEEAFSLEQKLGDAENAVEEGQKKVAELSKRLASGADGSKELREELKQQEVSFVQSCRVAELGIQAPKLILVGWIVCLPLSCLRLL